MGCLFGILHLLLLLLAAVPGLAVVPTAAPEYASELNIGSFVCRKLVTATNLDLAVPDGQLAVDECRQSSAVRYE